MKPEVITAMLRDFARKRWLNLENNNDPGWEPSWEHPWEV